MSGLGLAAYSSSDEDEGTAQEVAQAAAAAAPAQPLQAPAASTAQRTTGAGMNNQYHIAGGRTFERPSF